MRRWNPNRCRRRRSGRGGARNPLVVAGNAVFTIILLGMLAVGGGYFYAKQTLEAPGPLTEDKVVNIPKTAGTGDIGDILAA